MKAYNYKNCQSLFGYSAEVHIRCKGQCQLCDCGGEPLDFDLWRQMTVEHLIGKSQGGYRNQIRELVDIYFPFYSDNDKSNLVKVLDSYNTVTACQFCNSTTSRNVSAFSMYSLFENSSGCKDTLIENVSSACKSILDKKRQTVKWKLSSVRAAFEERVVPNTSGSPE